MPSRTLALIVIAATVVVAGAVVLDRDGLIAWATLLAGAGLFAKAWFRPGSSDLWLSLGLALLAPLAWYATFTYVISTYESGEVVELAIETDERTHVARVWLFELDGDALVYYDADPEVAASLLAGTPVQLTRAGRASTLVPQTRTVDEIPEDEGNRILGAMAAKYGDRMTAADVFYVLLGSPRDRVSVVVNLGAN